MKIAAIAAMDTGRVIGLQGDIPWHIPGEQKRFAELTSGHTVVMGRKTYQSLPERYRPLPNRLNVVVTQHPEQVPHHDRVQTCEDLPNLLERCRDGLLRLQGETLWIIGGEQIYRLSQPYWDEVYLTLVEAAHEGDTFFPKFENDFEQVEEEQCGTHRYIHFLRKSSRPGTLREAS